jgi:hypothetical protein
MHADEIIKLIAALGVGSGVSAFFTAVIAARSQRGKSRAEAADLLINAAERVGKMNQEQDGEIRELKAKLDRIQVAMLQYLSEEITRAELLDAMRELR